MRCADPHRTRRRPVTLLVAGALLASACASGGGTGAGTGTPSRQPVTALPASLVSFGPYRAVPLTDPNVPAYPGPAAPTSLEGVRVADDLRDALARPGVSGTLAKQGFVVVPGDIEHLHYAYQGSFYSGWPVYVTTDAAYHIWHLTFDSVLRRTEEQRLLPALRTLVEKALAASRAQTAELAGTPLADEASRAEQLYQVAAAELGLTVTLGPLATREKALVDAHSGAQASPILGAGTDYSLMAPRGHYTRSAALKRYFTAMSVLGQSAFRLPETLGGTDDAALPIRVGLLATRALLGAPHGLESWKAVHEPTAFLVGICDDYTPVELDAAAKAEMPSWPARPSAVADEETLTSIVARLTRARTVRIDPEKASARLMGTRFVLDSWVMDGLIAPSVGENSSGERRLLPSALDVAAALGSAKATDLLARSGATGYKGYTEHLDAVKAEITRRPPSDWGGTVYDAWLYAIQPVLVPHGAAFPPMMRGEAWAAKGLQSGLGSYSQLKHDTILYTKQSVAEGGGDSPRQQPRNWVEPEPVAFARLASAADLLRSGLSRRDLLPPGGDELVAEASELFALFARVAADELAGRPIATADDKRLAFIGEDFEALWFRASDRTEAEVVGDNDSALIADLASGPGSVLQIGTGRFDRILVLVPDDSGGFQLAAGAVFSYYEFTSPAGERLTDETWRSRLVDGKAPARPAWQKVMMPG
jgi:hypothetical protein